LFDRLLAVGFALTVFGDTQNQLSQLAPSTSDWGSVRIVCTAALFVGDPPSCAANTKRLAQAFPDLRQVSAICGSLHSEPSLQLPP
jgi:hypothetical protein